MLDYLTTGNNCLDAEPGGKEWHSNPPWYSNSLRFFYCTQLCFQLLKCPVSLQRLVDAEFVLAFGLLSLVGLPRGSDMLYTLLSKPALSKGGGGWFFLATGGFTTVALLHLLYTFFVP